MWQLFRPWANAARHDVLGLPPLPMLEPFGELDRRGCPLLYGFSETVVPRSPDWPDWVHVTGYWFLDRSPGWQPPLALQRFVEAGPPPVFVGFGSMTDRDPAATLALTAEALAAVGQRGVLAADATGGVRPGSVPDHVFPLATGVPHDWLFPRMAAVVHHGGAGTTASGLRAGRPSVLVPHFADQPFWARRVTDLGAGPRPIPRRRLSARRVAEAIHQATADPRMRERGEILGQRIRAEHGVARAADAFARCVGSEQTPMARASRGAGVGV